MPLGVLITLDFPWVIMVMILPWSKNEANLLVCVYVIWVHMAEINISLKFWLDSWSYEYKFMRSLQWCQRTSEVPNRVPSPVTEVRKTESDISFLRPSVKLGLGRRSSSIGSTVVGVQVVPVLRCSAWACASLTSLHALEAKMKVGCLSWWLPLRCRSQGTVWVGLHPSSSVLPTLTHSELWGHHVKIHNS